MVHSSNIYKIGSKIKEQFSQARYDSFLDRAADSARILLNQSVIEDEEFAASLFGSFPVKSLWNKNAKILNEIWYKN